MGFCRGEERGGDGFDLGLAEVAKGGSVVVRPRETDARPRWSDGWSYKGRSWWFRFGFMVLEFGGCSSGAVAVSVCDGRFWVHGVGVWWL